MFERHLTSVKSGTDQLQSVNQDHVASRIHPKVKNLVSVLKPLRLIPTRHMTYCMYNQVNENINEVTKEIAFTLIRRTKTMAFFSAPWRRVTKGIDWFWHLVSDQVSSIALGGKKII